MVKDESDKNPQKRVFTLTSRVSPLRNSYWTIFIARKSWVLIRGPPAWEVKHAKTTKQSLDTRPGSY